MFSDPQKNIEQFAIDPGLSVADFGSGAGFYALALSRAVGPTGHVYAIDVQQDLLIKLKNEAIRQNISNIEIVLGNVEENKGSQLKDNSVDRVVIVNILFQTKDYFVQSIYISENFIVIKIIII
jgi:ubiquinone/menaquinone biosynthesis C-methylase UbiE